MSIIYDMALVYLLNELRLQWILTGHIYIGFKKNKVLYCFLAVLQKVISNFRFKFELRRSYNLSSTFLDSIEEKLKFPYVLNWDFRYCV